MKRISLNSLPEVFKSISKENDLFLPVSRDGVVNFAKWEDGVTVDLDTLKTVKSAKDVFFPQTQDLVKFQVKGKEINVDEPIYPDAKQVIFGVRGCDAKSFEILDMAFLEEFGDTFYETRRKNTTVVTLACSAPEETCFCNVYGIDATEPKGDVTAYKVDGYMYFKALTEKGEKLLSSINLLEDVKDETSVKKQQEETKKIIEKLPLSNLSLDGFKPDNLMDKFNAPEWGMLSEACLGCGTCTFVCPTCQCYDIRDFKTNKGIQRFRCWDSCMYSDFTKTAGGQPRSTQMQRYRQRFMHKLVYFPSNHQGTYSCVGCGRCVEKCPQKLNIVKVIKTLGEKKKDE